MEVGLGGNIAPGPSPRVTPAATAVAPRASYETESGVYSARLSTHW